MNIEATINHFANLLFRTMAYDPSVFCLDLDQVLAIAQNVTAAAR